MNLIIDIGNSIAKLVVFNCGEPIYEERCSNNQLEKLPDLLRRYPCQKGILSSVIDLSVEARHVLSQITIPILTLTGTTPTPLVNNYRTPQTLGSDRLAAAVGAYSLKPHQHLLIIDAGTCITYEYVDDHGVYHGGNISPGVNMRLLAMHEQTGHLPLISAKGPTIHWGNDTETAMRAGVIQGINYELEGYITEFKQRFPDIFIFLTGGDTYNLVTRIKNMIFADKYLVPRGLNCILEYNNDKR